MTQCVLSKLSDDELVAEVGRLARCQREVTVELVAHLAELESRRLHLAAGFPSLFAYCTAFLRLSEYEAFNRIEAARAARRFPRVLTMLADGSLTLTTAQLVSRHLTDENEEALLSSAAGKSKLEVQELLARHQPAGRPCLCPEASSAGFRGRTAADRGEADGERAGGGRAI